MNDTGQQQGGNAREAEEPDVVNLGPVKYDAEMAAAFLEPRAQENVPAQYAHDLAHMAHDLTTYNAELIVEAEMATEAAKSYRTDRDFLTAELQRVQNDRDDLKLQASALESKLNAVTDERDAALKRIDDFGSMGTVAKHTLIEDSGVAALRTQCDELQARVDSAVARLLRRDELAMLVPMGFTYDLLAILQPTPSEGGEWRTINTK